MMMWPESTCSRPLSARKSVLLPDPLGPMRTSTSPLATRLVTFCRALTGARPGTLNVFETFSILTIGAALAMRRSFAKSVGSS